MNDEKWTPLTVILTTYPKGEYKKGEKEFVEFSCEGPRYTATDNMAKIFDGEKVIWKTGRGRKPGLGYYPPRNVVGFIDTMIEKGKAKNLDDAYEKAAGILSCDYETVRKYYKTKKKGIVYECDDVKEYEGMLKKMMMLKSIKK